ncbi:Imm30 family immunity protein [Metabacillus fastidiosus]|uniref:Imm30 family immunity protein n=1 Tax=Metabacillus fastidiosus TaxID=1458 RepID=UPI002DB77B3F|nr:Imm30 family immunity protein [Metabacillus fastidiosus]MEC2078455.1 Imm30 family immunity protein [Metabacillus fastidiosus]
MKLDNALNTLISNRFMRNKTEISLFEEALEVIYKTNDYSIIGKLIDALDDHTEHEEIMWGLIHTIEYLSELSPKEALRLQLNAISYNIEKCRDWIEIIHFRILNNDEYRKLFTEVLKEVNKQVQDIIVSLLNDIKNEDPVKFADKIEEVRIILLN